MVVGSQPNTPAVLTPEKIPCNHFQRLSRPQVTWFCRGNHNKNHQWHHRELIPGRFDKYRSALTITLPQDHVPLGIKLKNSPFCPLRLFICSVCNWEQTAIFCLYIVNWLVFVTETECVYCAVRTEYLSIIRVLIPALTTFRINVADKNNTKSKPSFFPVICNYPLHVPLLSSSFLNTLGFFLLLFLLLLFHLLLFLLLLLFLFLLFLFLLLLLCV